MKEFPLEVSERYRNALQSYLSGAGETALETAYEFGRSAMMDGFGCIDLAQLHYDVLLLVMLDAPSQQEAARMAMLGSDFFAECLSPFEMTHRGYHEALVELSRRNIEISATNKQLEGEIRERRRMEGVLRMLPRRILEAQEAERTKVAHELHDDVCQRLTATKLHLEAFESSIPGRALNLHKKLRAIKHQVNMNIQEVRRISANLRPSTLDDMGLVAALQLLCKEFQTVYHVDVSFDAKNVRAERFEAPVEIALYRIAQESFSNIGKHAHAKGASVRLWTGDERVQLTIEDNGRGFEADSMYTHGAPGYKLGLINMKERAELLRGTCFIHSEVNRGTTIRVEIPLNSNGEYEKN